ncbi:MAG: metalloregulator ArsR/SmtB family transcription factor [Saccharofermentans sp.]|nr:metalloregulator ArsR/SmtB family transcription factor [Saccharofermentans sp.]
MKNEELINAISVSAEPVRMKILRDLASNGEMKAKDLLEGFDITQPTLSHHMALLEENGLVICRREGRCVYYAINVKAFEVIAEFYGEFTKPAVKEAPKAAVKSAPAKAPGKSAPKAAPKSPAKKAADEKPKKKKDKENKEKAKNKKDKKKKSK